MPCIDGGYRTSYINANDVEIMQNRIDQLADWLCLVLTKLESMDIKPADLDLQQWWEEHKVFDAERKEGKQNVN
jgi:hypothetical protein